MTSLKVIDLAKAAKARLFGDANAVVTNIVIDSRECEEGSMFVCVAGENTDGHKYVEQAYENGARVFLMSNITATEEFTRKHSDITLVFVKDTEFAFMLMANWYMTLIGVKKVAVTGSVGKTTTKSLVAAVLAQKYKTVCSQKNYNTQLGICMTAFLANPDTEIIVFEMGMDRKGEIHDYCAWVKPDTAIITVIGDSHLEKLGSKEAIADAKLEITDFLEYGDALIYNSDSPFLDLHTLSKKTKMNYVPIPVGSRDEASVKLLSIIDGGLSGISFDLKTKYEDLHIRLPLLGKHNAINAALAVTCGMLYDVPSEAIVQALSQVSGTDRRLAFEDINGLLLLDDSYNANPASMKAALEVLMGIKARRHVAILADMYELGEDEEEGHKEVGAKAAELGVDFLVAIGNNSKLMADAAFEKIQEMESDKQSPMSITRFPDTVSAMEKIMGLIGRGDAVLIKGSNATKVSAIAEMIRSLKS